ncbi:MAG: motility protein A [Bdellovibrionales bacterium]|nr:motility protein A [Bdellovibrionales bacterium]
MAEYFPRPVSYRQQWNIQSVDYGTFAGAAAAFGLVFLAIYLGGGLSSFLDLKSLLIVIGGTIGATLVNFPLQDFLRSMSILKTTLFPTPHSSRQRIRKILELARRIRSDGVLALQDEATGEPDMFFRKCIEMIVDGHEPDEIRQVLEIELSFLEDRHRRGAQLFQTMGAIAPAMGLIGTLIGLVQMLQNLSNPNEIGPAMAVALLTTFYGAVFANLVFLPIAGKLRSRSEEEFFLKELTIEGIIGVARGQNPRMIEQRVLSFLPPEERQSEYDL